MITTAVLDLYPDTTTSFAVGPFHGPAQKWKDGVTLATWFTTLGPRGRIDVTRRGSTVSPHKRI